MSQSALARRLGFIALIFYGTGDILGAGIYALVGKVIELAGSGAWISFGLAGIVALLTGLSYAELSARIPVSAGAAAFVKHAFPGRLMATQIGVFVLGTGIASAATVTTAFSGYLQEIFPMPAFIAQLTLLVLLSLLSFWGIQQSSWVNIIFTTIEVSGLLAVIGIGLYLLDLPLLEKFWAKDFQSFDFSAIMAGITIAFFAFVGFEDMCNLADEAKEPARDIPRAILIALCIAGIIYLAVTLTMQIHFSREEVIQSKTPLLLIFEKANLSGLLKYFSTVAIIAISNTALANMIMASRLFYGMSRERLLPPALGKVHEGRKTPWVAILLVFGITLALVMTGSVKALAQTTSLLVFIVFACVNASLIRIKWRKEKHKGMQIPLVFPILGALCCFALFFQYSLDIYLRTLIFFGLGFLIWALQGKSVRKTAP